MEFTRKDIDANRAFFEAQLRAYRQKIDVLHAVQGKEPFDFLLIDVRPRNAYAQGHIPGALSVPFERIDELSPQLPRDREIVVYCWNDY